jgi:hypothetical protein
MSIFDFPCINFKGTIQLNPGTANNDDYAGAVTTELVWTVRRADLARRFKTGSGAHLLNV